MSIKNRKLHAKDFVGEISDEGFVEYKMNGDVIPTAYGGNPVVFINGELIKIKKVVQKDQ